MIALITAICSILVYPRFRFWIDERQAGEGFNAAYQASVHQVRELISGLRPATLNYGLQVALEDLVYHSQPIL